MAVLLPHPPPPPPPNCDRPLPLRPPPPRLAAPRPSELKAGMRLLAPYGESGSLVSCSRLAVIQLGGESGRWCRLLSRSAWRPLPPPSRSDRSAWRPDSWPVTMAGSRAVQSWVRALLFRLPQSEKLCVVGVRKRQP